MTIEIEDLTFDAIIGILDFERRNPQRVVVTCSITYNYSDKNFINYADVATSIETTCKNEKFELLEEALLHVSAHLKTHYNLIESLYLKISKPDILHNCNVSLSETYHYS